MKLQHRLASDSWRVGPKLWWAWTCAVLIGLAAAAGAGQFAYRLARDSSAGLQPAKATAASATPSPDSAANVDNIAHKLGGRPSAYQVLQWLTHGQGDLRQASLTGANAKEPVCSATKLCSSELELSFDGSYAAVKSRLMDVLERNPQITVKRLVLRAKDGGAGVSASLEATVWGGAFSSAQAASGSKTPTRQ